VLELARWATAFMVVDPKRKSISGVTGWPVSTFANPKPFA
jgi:hypothetical protein